MVVLGMLNLFDVFSLVTSFPTYILELYEFFFGILIVVLEANDLVFINFLKDCVSRWCFISTVPAGKVKMHSGYYIFTTIS